MSRRIGAIAVALIGCLLGALVTLQIQELRSDEPSPVVQLPTEPPVGAPKAPGTLLAWVTRGLPPGFAAGVTGLPHVGALTVVAEDNVWLARSWSAAGELVDRAPEGYAYPIDAAAVDPRSFAAFLPAGDRSLLTALGRGQAVLGATSAELRGLGPGALLDVGGTRVRVAGVLPDELVGAAEILVSRRTGHRMGVTTDRYVLVQPAAGRRLSSSSLAQALRPLVSPDLGSYRRVQVRAPGETPYFRPGDAVMPPVVLKTLFGEFAARPSTAYPGYIEIEPAWERSNLETARLPVLGTVTCHRGVMAQLRGAMEELVTIGLAHLVRTFDGCYTPRFIDTNPAAMLSRHAWGVAFEVNLEGNRYGQSPDQDPRLVEVLERWGFLWGGRFVVPDGAQFEYRRAPAA